MRAELVSVGTELLLGQIVDTNSAYLATRLAALGVDLLHMSTVGDNLGRATATIRRALERSELTVCTGGLGPTEDDLTREAIAAALGEQPAEDPGLLAWLRSSFAARGSAMPERNRKQAWLIPSARPLANPLGTAPGWDVRRDGRRIVAMPGVPREMTRMWEVEVEPTLFAGAILRSRTLKLLGIGESSVEEALDELVRSTAPTVATYAKNDGVHVRITDKDTEASAAGGRIAEMEAAVRQRLGPYVWGADGDTLGAVAGRLLAARNWTLASGEALTAGEVAGLLADAGERYLGGIVLPGADAARLAANVEPLGAAAVILVPAGELRADVFVRTPAGETSASFAFRDAADGRRRGALAALDLLRRALA